MEVINFIEGRVGSSTPDKGVPDMTCIPDIDETGINRNLKVRYDRDEIYTYTGSILIAVNPYKEIDCYGLDHVYKYHGQKIGLLEPHVFALAEAAYRNIIDNDENQSCVISGESGGGKTETTKFVLQYLCSVTCNVSTWVQQQILEANTILEAFGNAKTIRNDNSSRFGKFMQVCFDSKHTIKGCIIQDYLLEQSRITFQSPGERNYHVLYQLVAEGQNNKEVGQSLHLRDPSFYKYLNASGSLQFDMATESKRFEGLRLAFQVLQIPQHMIDGIFRVLSAILWLGNLEFEDVDGEKCELAVEDKEIIAKVSELLGLESDEVSQVALKRQINVRGNITEIPLKVQEARENRHAMAKALYSRTFAWLITHINTCINPGQDATRFLGVLDIFGFENFAVNSFEQLCINYTNEKLHKFFNHYVFALEQEIYNQEEIIFSHIQFTDNTQCLELIEKPPRCLLKLLTEQCHMPKGSDAAYVNNLNSEFEVHPHYEKSSDRRHLETEFSIKHYAGSVTYQVKGFVDKNRDVQQDVLFDFMSRSKNSFVQELSSYQDLLSLQSQSQSQQQLQNLPNGNATVQRGTSKGKLTVSDTFRYQLQSLVDVLQSTNPWYVRCIKPNSDKLPNDYDEQMVLDQLRYLGMLDIIRIRREGYQIHLPFDDFVYRYQCLTKRVRNLPIKDQVLAVINNLHVPSTEWQMGKTKVFIRAKVHEPLEDARKQVINAKATVIQKHWKRHHERCKYSGIKVAVMKIQHAYRGWKQRIDFIRKRRAAIVIQSHLRGVFAREVAAALREMRRVEEEMRKRERLEAERKQREAEQAEADRLALEESERIAKLNHRGKIKSSKSRRVAKQEIMALTQMAEQINSKFSAQQQQNQRKSEIFPNGIKSSNESVDLDNLFAFLSEVTPNGPNSNAIINEIGEKMNHLVEDLDVELESVIQQEIEGLTNEKNLAISQSSQGNSEISHSVLDQALPTQDQMQSRPQLVQNHQQQQNNIQQFSNPQQLITNQQLNHTQQQINHHPIPQQLPQIQPNVINQQQNCKMGIPSLPEPTTRPPPPPSIFNEISQAAPSQPQPQTAKKILFEEPIYEAVIHHREPQNHHNIIPLPPLQPIVTQGIQTLPTVKEVPEPLPTPPISEHIKLRPKSPAVQNVRSASPMNRLSGGPLSPSSPKHSRPSSRTSSTGGHPLEREQRRKHRVEKKLQEMQSDNIDREKEQHQREDVYHDILEFAENYFNTHERSPEGTIMATLTRKGRKSVDMVPKYEMITYYRGTSIPSSHIHMYDPENVALSCNIFKELCKYIRGELSAERELQVIQYIIGQGIEREELRDEIFIQAMRQSTNNPSIEWTDRIWLLLCLTVVAFQPSKLLFKYFVSFLKRNLEQLDGKMRQYVQWCLDNCKNTKVSCRQYPPSSVEIAAMRRLGTIVCRFFFLDGRTKAIDVHPTDTAADAVAKLAEKLELYNIEGWAIYQSRPDGEEHVKSHDFLYDIIAAWEIKQTKLQATNSTLRKNAATLGSGENRFVFKKRMFKSTRELSQDPIEISLLYAQAVYSIVKCDEFPVSEKVAIQLAGLQAQVALGDPSNQPKLEYYSEVSSYLPDRISKTREEQLWIPILAQAHRQYGAGRTDLTAKVLYLSCVMQYPAIYGTTMFSVKYRGYWSYGNSLIFGVNIDGVALIKPDDKFILYEFRYSEIESIMLDPSDSFITINLNRSTTSPEQQRCYVFETKQKHEIGSLIVSYYPPLSNWITENENPVRKAKGITNEDRVRLHHNLVVCRRQLVDTELLRKPHDLSGGFLRNTLRRLSKHRLEKLRAEGGNSVSDHGETYKGFIHAYWAFCRQALPQSLTKLPDQEEQAMLNVFQSILTYAGLGQNGEVVQRAEDEHITLIQSIMERCMRKESLLNELYLQLIKQTTDHPDPNSRVNLRHWALLSLACSVILPPQKIVRKYLIGHLKRCASDYISEEGKYARFAEKCFMKTQGTRRRQWPPSREEIVCTINRRPIYARFHFMDGQYHSVEFHPSSTAREVMELVKKKIGLQENAQGYAIYEVLGASERSLLPDEKVADVMSKWEKYRNAAAQAVQQSQTQNNANNQMCRRQHHLFLFKKHLFCDQYMNLEDPVEKELLYHQVLHGLRAERYPISEMEAIMLTSLQGQVELGDYTDAVNDYRVIAGHCLPPRFVPNIPHEGVAMHHQSLRGMTQPEAKKSFLNLIRSWPLHKATIFDVMQSFTSNWPRILWLAVDQKGLHLLEHRSRNTLCTYDYHSILSFSPNMNCLMIITGSEKKQSKVILTTSQAFQIANLIKEYMEVIKAQMQKEETPPPVAPHAPAHGIQQPNSLIGVHDLSNNNADIKRGPRPVSNVSLRQSGLAAPS